MANNTKAPLCLGFVIFNILITFSCKNCWKITLAVIGAAVCLNGVVIICLCNNENTVHPTQGFRSIRELNNNRVLVTINNTPDFSRLYIEETHSPLHKSFFTCCICLDDNDDNIKTLLCSHKYHKACIEEWFTKEETCPLCRDEFNST